MMLLLLLILLFSHAPDPGMSARWDSSTSATISWTQESRGCLYVEHQTAERVFIECREAPGLQRVTLGHQGPLSGDVRPSVGDIYLVQTSGHTWRARLVWALYFPVFRA